MPTLRRWIDRETERLHREGKADFAATFDACNDAFFRGDYAVVFDALPILRQQARDLHETGWEVIINYYCAAAAINWEGNLVRGMQAAMRAYTQAHRLRSANDVPGLYALEVLLSAWLDVDGPGYANEIRDALTAVTAEMLPADIMARFACLQARCCAAQGAGKKAREIVLAHLSELDWPEAYEKSMMATTLAWVGRWDEALALQREAALLFEKPGFEIEHINAKVGIVDALLAQGDYTQAASTATTAISVAEKGINRAQYATLKGQLGIIVLERGQAADAAELLEQALVELDGLGWLRQEAELSLDLLRALEAKSAPVSEWETAYADASAAIRRLPERSSDELSRELGMLAAHRTL